MYCMCVAPFATTCCLARQQNVSMSFLNEWLREDLYKNPSTLFVGTSCSVIQPYEMVQC